MSAGTTQFDLSMSLPNSASSSAMTLTPSRATSTPQVNRSSYLPAISKQQNASSKTHQRLQDAWSCAKKHVECNCNARQLKIISGSATSQQLMQKLQDLEAKQKNRLSLRFAQKVKPFVEAIGLYDNTMKTYCNTGMGELGLVWGSVTLVVDIAGRFIGCFERLLDIIVLLGENLPRMNEYTLLFSDSERMQSVLSLIYEDLLEFCLFAIQFFNKKGIGILWRLLWGDFESKTQLIIKNINRHKMLADDEANAVAIKEAKVDREEGAYQHRLFRVREVIKWLSPADTQQRLDKLLQDRMLNTGKWLFDSQLVQDWLDGQSLVLWIYGIPGCGKSVLSSMLIEYLVDPSRRDPQRSTTIYFFCDGKSPSGRSCRDVMRSLIAQLLSQYNECVDILYEAMIRSGQEKATSLRELLLLFKVIRNELSLDHIRIIIDAWDECEDGKCSNTIQTLIPTADSKTSLFITSRNETWIRERLQLYPHLEMTAERIQPDIEAYIKASLQGPPLCAMCDKSLHARIGNTLKSKAAGQFLWVRLMLENLQKATHMWCIEDIISNLPMGLECAYGRILERLVELPLPTQEVARKMFMWLGNSERPLTLPELDSALSIREGQAEMKPSDHFFDLRGFIEETCGSLVEISTPDRIMQLEHVNFVHVTVREFLMAPLDVWETQPARIKKFRICADESHEHIAAVCMTQMRFEELLADGESSNDKERSINGKYPLLHYAHQYWATHLAKAGSPDLAKCKELLAFIDSPNMTQYLAQAASEKETSQSLMVLQSQLNEWIASSKQSGPEVQLIRNCFKNQYKWMIERDEQEYGPLHPKTLTGIYHMGSLFHHEGDWSAAEVLYWKALEGRREILGFDDPSTLETAFELATVLRRLGKLEQSYAMQIAVLDAQRRVIGPDDSATLMTEDEVAQGLNEQSKLEEAEDMSRETLRKKTSLYGRHDARTIRTTNLLAAILKDRGLQYVADGDATRAKAAFTECLELELIALEAREAIFGIEHPETATVCNMLGIASMLLGNHDDSEKYHLRTLATREKAFGANNPHVQRSMRNLVRLYRAQFKTVEAAGMQARLRRSLESNATLLKRASWASWVEDRGEGGFAQHKSQTW